MKEKRKNMDTKHPSENMTTTRVKDVASINLKSLTEKTNAGYVFKYIDIGNVNINGIISEPEVIEFKNAPSRARRMVKRNDVIISTVRTYLKAVAFFKEEPEDVIVSTGFAVLSSNKKKINPNYLAYSVRSEAFIDNVIRLSVGVSYPAINTGTLASLSIYKPDILAQAKIADYLDAKTTAIDKRMAFLEAKANSYKELSKAFVNEIVFKGLNKNVALKNSDIEWIGKAPRHWDIVRGKDIFSEKSRKGHPNQPLLAASQKLGVVLKTMLESRSMEAQKDFENFKLVKVNDFVISLRSFEGGIETAFYQGIISPVYTVFTGAKQLNVNYFRHLFKSSSFISNLKTMVTGIRDGQSIKFVEIQNTFFPIPPPEEQAAIAEHLDKKTTTIDAIVANIKLQVDGLKELRKSLINDVVTGKLKVI